MKSPTAGSENYEQRPSSYRKLKVAGLVILTLITFLVVWLAYASSTGFESEIPWDLLP